MTSYGNIGIEYDSAGNMFSFGSKTYSWAGRKLTKKIDGSNTYTHGYNESGIRASKTVNGTTTEYLLNGDRILAQEKDNKVMWFFYDSQGQRVGLNYNGYDYYYMYNLQGDVVGIMRRATGEIVATYQYDAWGKCISVENKDSYGWIIKTGNLTLRVMSSGGKRTNYFRLSHIRKGAMTLSGRFSSDRALTHIDITYTNIIKIINLIRKNK